MREKKGKKPSKLAELRCKTKMTSSESEIILYYVLFK